MNLTSFFGSRVIGSGVIPFVVDLVTHSIVKLLDVLLWTTNNNVILVHLSLRFPCAKIDQLINSRLFSTTNIGPIHYRLFGVVAKVLWFNIAID